jgi:hypothetical protein
MMHDEHDSFVDDLAERRRDRDRQREPRVTGYIRFIEPHATQDVTSQIVALACPRCNEHVYAPRDSDKELVDCITCDARLVTRLDLEGCVSVALRDGGSHG